MQQSLYGQPPCFLIVAWGCDITSMSFWSVCAIKYNDYYLLMLLILVTFAEVDKSRYYDGSIYQAAVSFRG